MVPKISPRTDFYSNEAYVTKVFQLDTRLTIFFKIIINDSNSTDSETLATTLV